MVLQFKLVIEWVDEGLIVTNIRNTEAKNTLSPEEIDSIWMPTLVFVNTNTKERADFKNQSTYATVHIKEGEKIHSGSTQ